MYTAMHLTLLANQIQRGCGSCYAFSAIGALESAYAIKKRRGPISLSEQQIVDCSCELAIIMLLS